jgi:photosystem II stability/assembly factor-like uncharacterized protein
LNESIASHSTIDFVNDQTGWIAAERNLLKTEDGGETWKSIPMEAYTWNSNIDFINEQIGWCVQRYYYYF